MQDYNGFSGARRDRSLRWLNKKWAADPSSKPSKCVACGQTEGVIEAHAEDYSEPFRDGVTDEFHLCLICHTMVHLRDRKPEVWSAYRAKIEAGGRAKLIKPKQRAPGGTWKFTDEMFDWGSPPERQALREIEKSHDEVAGRLAGESHQEAG